MQIRLRDILDERGITIKAFANQLGVATTSLPVFYNFASSIETLQRYANELHVAVWDMIYDCGAPCPDEDTFTPSDADIVNQVSATIERILKEKKMSKSKAAAGAGLSLASFSQASKRNMSTTMLEKIATGLEVEPWELFISREDMAAEVARRKALTEPTTQPEPAAVEQTADSGNGYMVMEINGKRYYLVPVEDIDNK